MKERAAYDPIAKDYQESKQLPFRIYVERHTIFKLLGDLQGRAVLDFACGEGIYSRRMKSLGADSVMGVDISAEMIALAEAEEKKNPLGIRYAVGDASLVRVNEPVDLILGSYLLNYAKSFDQLLSFCRALYENLKDGGAFVGFNDNPANAPSDYERYRKFGFYKTTPGTRQEGDPITYHFFNDHGGEFSFDNYYLSKETYERAFKTAGFREFHWHRPQLADEAVEKFGAGYWDDFLEFPPAIGLFARK